MTEKYLWLRQTMYMYKNDVCVNITTICRWSGHYIWPGMTENYWTTWHTLKCALAKGVSVQTARVLIKVRIASTAIVYIHVSTGIATAVAHWVTECKGFSVLSPHGSMTHDSGALGRPLVMPMALFTKSNNETLWIYTCIPLHATVS